MILVVEDDTTIREALRDALRSDGHAVEVAADGHQAEAALQRGGFDLVLLDLMLPGPGGLELLRAFRVRDAETPVVILTARGEESDKVLGLELGADDYVTKPFGLRELLARVRAHLRRRALSEPETPAERFTIGAADVDLASYRVLHGDREVTLSPREAAILALLYAERGRAVARNELLDKVWGRDRFVSTRTIDTHVLHLRSKLELDPKAPQHLLTVHGIGYRLVVDDGDPATSRNS